MPVILGLNAYHADASACLIINGRLVAAAEEERFRRIKHWAGFPSEATKYCLKEAGIGLADVEHVAVNQNPRAHLWRKMAFALWQRPDPGFMLDRIRNKRRRAGVAQTLEQTIGTRFRGKVHQVEHHLSHLSSAFFVSPFSEAVVVSVDGFGDFASMAWGVGRDGYIKIRGRVFFPHSLGVFYQAMTQWLGFSNYGDEYKVMGLAPYGEPAFIRELTDVVQLDTNGYFHLNTRYFRHHKEQTTYQWDAGAPRFEALFSNELVRLLGPPRCENEALTQRHKDVARSTQAIYEKAFFHLLNSVYQRHQSDNLCLAGGCAMNSVANGRVYRHTAFRRLFVQPAAGDAGGAIGAAYAVWHRLGGRRDFVMDHAYWGPHFSNEEFGILLSHFNAALEAQLCKTRFLSDEYELCKITAMAIAEGKVVGWFQGRMEWGPRALGNRSILGDPRRKDMKDILNVKIKRRESFRPFAPSILREHVKEWFEIDDEVPFMMQVYPVRSEKRHLIPAVTHVDGSGRLQTVTANSNPRYYRLIKTFARLTDVPILLNTSFNENEPIVCYPQEALDCFLRTKMDVLVLGNWFVTREGVARAAV